MGEATPVEVFVACRPGLEPLLAEELRGLGVEAPRVVPGGVALRGSAAELVRLNVESGLGSHVLLRVGRFEARHFSELVRKVSKLDWPAWLRPDVPIEVRATSKRSRLYHTEGIAERVGQGITTSLGAAPRGAGEAVPIVVRLHRDACEVSIDTSGAPLHRRGWRHRPGRAPLREDLARGLLMASGWDRKGPLLDPMMGAGTILIEAARWARDLAPGLDRSFALERMAGPWGARLEAYRETARRRAAPRAPCTLWGRDLDPEAMAATRENATAAGVLDDLRLEVRALEDGPWPEVGAVVSNPPYGQRIGAEEQLHEALAERIAALSPAVRVALVLPEVRRGAMARLPLKPRLMTDHGGTKIHVLVR